MNGDVIKEVQRDGGRNYRGKLTVDLELAGIDTIGIVLSAE